jgi:hypothetical protein
MNLHLLSPMTALLVTVSASVMADADRLDPATPESGSDDYSQPGSHAQPSDTNRSNTGAAVPGRSYRDQAPPRYRIEQGYGGSSNAFPRVPGTSYRNYSQPSYNTR